MHSICFKSIFVILYVQNQKNSKMPSSSAAHSTMSFSGTNSGNSTSSNGSYASRDKPLLGHAQKTAHKASSSGHHHVNSAAAAEGGHSGTGATMYGSTAAVGLTSGSVSSGSSNPLSGKDCAISNHAGLTTDASKEGKKHNDKTTKVKKRGAKKHSLSCENVYTMGGDKDDFGRAHVGSGSGAPSGCSLM